MRSLVRYLIILIFCGCVFQALLFARSTVTGAAAAIHFVQPYNLEISYVPLVQKTTKKINQLWPKCLSNGL